MVKPTPRLKKKWLQQLRATHILILVVLVSAFVAAILFMNQGGETGKGGDNKSDVVASGTCREYKRDGVAFDYPTVRSLSELKEESDIIIVGKVHDCGRDKFTDRESGMRMVRVGYTFEVLDVVKGSKLSDRVVVYITVGVKDGERTAISEIPQLLTNQEAIVFIEKRDDGK